MSNPTPMSWSRTELDRFARPDEIRVAPDRADGTPGPAVIVWATDYDGELYARSARGPEGAWYRRALASGRGRILVAGHELEVTFTDAGAPGAVDHAGIDAALRTKYARYGSTVQSIVGDAAHRVTVRITPIEEEDHR